MSGQIGGRFNPVLPTPPRPVPVELNDNGQPVQQPQQAREAVYEDYLQDNDVDIAKSSIQRPTDNRVENWQYLAQRDPAAVAAMKPTNDAEEAYKDQIIKRIREAEADLSYTAEKTSSGITLYLKDRGTQESRYTPPRRFTTDELKAIDRGHR